MALQRRQTAFSLPCKMIGTDCDRASAKAFKNCAVSFDHRPLTSAASLDLRHQTTPGRLKNYPVSFRCSSSCSAISRCSGETNVVSIASNDFRASHHVTTIIICPLIVRCHAGRPRQIEWISYFSIDLQSNPYDIVICNNIYPFSWLQQSSMSVWISNVSIVWRKMYLNFQHSVEYDYWTSINLSH